VSSLLFYFLKDSAVNSRTTSGEIHRENSQGGFTGRIHREDSQGRIHRGIYRGN